MAFLFVQESENRRFFPEHMDSEKGFTFGLMVVGTKTKNETCLEL